MAYLFLQIVGLEKPADLRRARTALSNRLDPSVSYWVDPLDQVAWLERPGQEPFTEAEVARFGEQFNQAGFWALPIQQAATSGPACIAGHRRALLLRTRRRLLLTALLGAPVVFLHLFDSLLANGAHGRLWLPWLQLALTLAVFLLAARSWFYHGLRSLLHGRWRWRTGTAVALAGCFILSAGDLLWQTLGDGASPRAQPLFPSLFAPAVLLLALALLRALLMRWRLAQVSHPFDRWLADMTPDDEAHLRFALKIEARHQRSGLDLSWGRVADRFTDLGLLATAATFAVLWLASGRLATAWLVAAGLLLILDPRLFQLAWMAPEALAERQALARGIFFLNPRIFQAADRLTGVVFDKTGTVAGEQAELATIEVNPLAALNLDAGELLRLAASVEQGSDHAMGQALLAAAAHQGLVLDPVEDLDAESGMGVCGQVGGRRVHVGSERYMRANDLDPAPFEPTILRLKRQVYSVVLVAVDGQIAGAIGASDVIRPGAESTMAELHDDGLAVRLITGDSEPAGAKLAASLGIDQAAVELSPDGKVEQLTRWQGKGERLAVVGPFRRNDPLMAAAEVSIALCSGAGGEGDPFDEPAPGRDAPRPARRRPGATAARLGRTDALVLRNRVDLVPTVLRLARRVGRQRTRGFIWATALVVASALVAVLWPGQPVGPEWSPAVVAALTLAGLPIILGRAAVPPDRKTPA